MIPKNTFSIGDNVKVIDKDELPSEWATFFIIEILSDSYRLSPPDKFTYEPLWVTANEIALTQVKPNKSTNISVSFNFYLSLL